MFFLWLLFAAELDLSHTVMLQGVGATKLPAIVVNQQGQFFYRDFDDHAVYKLGADGKLLLKIGGPGQGPGELSMPFRLLLLDKGNKLAVLSLTNTVTLFDAHSGEMLHRFQVSGSNQIARFDDHSLLTVGGMPHGNYLHTWSLQGKKLRSWGDTPPIDLSKPFTRNYETVVFDGRTYFAEGTWPEITVIDERGETPWKLKPPKYYREPPDQPMPKSLRYNPVKVEEYFQSFTQIHALKAMGSKRLAVGWTLHRPQQGCVDVYDIDSKVRLIGDYPLPGWVVDASEDTIFVLEERESEDGLIRHLVHHYQLTP